jgi:hypothetical protein
VLSWEVGNRYDISCLSGGLGLHIHNSMSHGQHGGIVGGKKPNNSNKNDSTSTIVPLTFAAKYQQLVLDLCLLVKKGSGYLQGYLIEGRLQIDFMLLNEVFSPHLSPNIKNALRRLFCCDYLDGQGMLLFIPLLSFLILHFTCLGLDAINQEKTKGKGTINKAGTRFPLHLSTIFTSLLIRPPFQMTEQLRSCGELLQNLAMSCRSFVAQRQADRPSTTPTVVGMNTALVPAAAAMEAKRAAQLPMPPIFEGRLRVGRTWPHQNNFFHWCIDRLERERKQEAPLGSLLTSSSSSSSSSSLSSTTLNEHRSADNEVDIPLNPIWQELSAKNISTGLTELFYFCYLQGTLSLRKPSSAIQQIIGLFDTVGSGKTLESLALLTLLSRTPAPSDHNPKAIRDALITFVSNKPKDGNETRRHQHTFRKDIKNKKGNSSEKGDDDTVCDAGTPCLCCKQLQASTKKKRVCLPPPLMSFCDTCIDVISGEEGKENEKCF